MCQTNLSNLSNFRQVASVIILSIYSLIHKTSISTTHRSFFYVKTKPNLFSEQICTSLWWVVISEFKEFNEFREFP